MCLADRRLLGPIDEVFGPVRSPFYAIRIPARPPPAAPAAAAAAGGGAGGAAPEGPVASEAAPLLASDESAAATPAWGSQPALRCDPQPSAPAAAPVSSQASAVPATGTDLSTGTGDADPATSREEGASEREAAWRLPSSATTTTAAADAAAQPLPPLPPPALDPQPQASAHAQTGAEDAPAVPEGGVQEEREDGQTGACTRRKRQRKAGEDGNAEESGSGQEAPIAYDAPIGAEVYYLVRYSKARLPRHPAARIMYLMRRR